MDDTPQPVINKALIYNKATGVLLEILNPDFANTGHLSWEEECQVLRVTTQHGTSWREITAFSKPLKHDDFYIPGKVAEKRGLIYD